MDDKREAYALLLQGLAMEVPELGDSPKRWSTWRSCALSIIDLIVPVGIDPDGAGEVRQHNIG